MRAFLKKFQTQEILVELIDAYFIAIDNEHTIKSKTRRSVKSSSVTKATPIQKQVAGYPTITGLALALEFNSLREFDQYEQRGKFAQLLKRACLRIESVYEKKLLMPSPNGAIFMLKSRGWNEKPENKMDGKASTMKVKIYESGPKTAANEKDVSL